MWLTIFAAGSLVVATDGGLHAWSLDRFLSFKSRADGHRRTDRYYSVVFQLVVWFTALLALLLLTIFGLVSLTFARFSRIGHTRNCKWRPRTFVSRHAGGS